MSVSPLSLARAPLLLIDAKMWVEQSSMTVPPLFPIKLCQFLATGYSFDVV